MSGLDGDATAREAVTDGTIVNLSCKHTCADGCIVGDRCIDDTQILDCTTAADTTKESCLLSVIHFHIQVAQDMTLTVKDASEI